MDMIRSLIYIRTGKYFKLYNCSEKKRIIFWSKLLDDYVPKTLKSMYNFNEIKDRIKIILGGVICYLSRNSGKKS